MRTFQLIMIAVAVLLVAGAVTAGVTLRESKASDACRPAAGNCSTTDCNPERPACQRQQQSERLRRYCAENPRDEKCR